MALNIPFNLAGIAAAQSQPSSIATTVADALKTTTVQPAGTGADTRGAASDGAGNSGQSPGQTWLHISKLRHSTIGLPDRATSTSVINAQTQAPNTKQATGPHPRFDQIATAPASVEAQAERPNKVDRYAPPDPLPTAPILKQRMAVPRQA